MCLSKQSVSACAVCMRIINKLSYHIAKMCQLWFWTTCRLAGAEVASATGFRAALKRRSLYKLSFISHSLLLSCSCCRFFFSAGVRLPSFTVAPSCHLNHFIWSTSQIAPEKRTYTHSHLSSFASQMVPTGRPCLHIPCQFMFHLLSLTLVVCTLILILWMAIVCPMSVINKYL